VSRVFCAEASRAREEPLSATASRVDHWLLLEYRGGWRRNVLGGSLLSRDLKAHLREQLAALEHARLLFVRKPERRADSGRRVFLVRSVPGAETLRSLEVDHQEDLRQIDLAAALTAAPGTPVDGPLYVVCTHGKRDACCARYGRPLYDAILARAEPERVWQSTHVGGDRFAGNVVLLPHGLYYGRVDPADVDRVLAAHGAGRLDLDGYRGRSAYSFSVQAAEQTIRESTGLLGVDDLRLLGVEQAGGGESVVRFEAPGGAIHEIDVVAMLEDEPAYLTCDSAEPRRARRCRVLAHRVLSA
jgi:hypothetical protein